MSSSTSIGEPDHSAILSSSKKLKIGTDSPSQLSFNVPRELTLHIVSFLDGFDVCLLGSCSKTLNEICNSDNVWKELYIKRWPDHYSQILCTMPEGKEIWKATYISTHKETCDAIYSRIMYIREQLQESNVLSVDIYNEAIGALRDLHVCFQDICILFLRRKVHVVLNLIGVHYAFLFLQLSGEDLRNALCCYQVLDKELTVCWGLYSPFGYNNIRWPKDNYFVVLSLAEIINGEEAILYFLQSGRTMVDVDYMTIASSFVPKE